MSDFPIDLPGDVVERYAHAFDIEERIPRAIDSLAPLDGCDVLLLDTPIDGIRADQIRARGAHVAPAEDPSTVEAASADIVVGLWSSLDRPGCADETIALRVARPGGRILALHEYGRDDIGTLIDTMRPSSASTHPERHEVPFLAGGWKVRVIHCFWTFASLEDGQAFAASFGEAGRATAAAMTRPRLSHNVAIFHRTVPAW